MSTTMTPKELMQLADRLRLRRTNTVDEDAAAVALRSYVELVAALEFVTCFAGFEVLNESCPGEPMFCARIDEHMSQTKDSIGAAVVALAKEMGWLGLEEFNDG
jgi:hypothetical protein